MIKTYIDGVLQSTPIVLKHNQLIGLNDDVNFQHITATDRTKLNNLSGTNTGDETASTIINKIGDGSKINSNYLPSYVDDVLEFANVASFPATGDVGKIYIALDVNLTYRWGGSGYVEISPSIALGETSATAYRGDRGASAYAHSILTSGNNPHNTTFANITSKPTTIAGYGITDGAIQGTAYSNLENNVKIVQGVPAGGKMYLGAGVQTGAIKIKLPKAKTKAMFKFRVKMNGQLENKISSSEYIVKGYNSDVGVGNTTANINTTHQVTVVKDNASTMSPTFYFCTGATEDYILIGEITDIHVNKSVVIDDVEIHFIGNVDDWSKNWVISLVTTLETLTSQYKVAVIPSLNATHLNGVQETTIGEANKLVKVNSSGRVILGGVDDEINKLQITGNAKITGLAGAGNRMVVADPTGNLSASMQVETGTWTPVLRGQGGGIAVAGASNSGRYTKIGKLVIFSADVDWASITGTILGNRFISGLPYASSNSGSHGSAYHGSFTGLNCSPNRTLILIVASGAGIVYIGESDLQSGGEYLQNVTINSSGNIIGLNGWYYTD